MISTRLKLHSDSKLSPWSNWSPLACMVTEIFGKNVANLETGLFSSKSNKCPKLLSFDKLSKNAWNRWLIPYHTEKCYAEE